MDPISKRPVGKKMTRTVGTILFVTGIALAVVVADRCSGCSSTIVGSP